MQNGFNSEMINVAFFVDVGWLGGKNYYRNLLSAISSIPNKKINPIIIVGLKYKDILLNEFKDVQILRTSFLDKFSFLWFVNKIFGSNRVFHFYLVWLGINVLSHSNPSKNSKLKTIGWIADFQHVNLPHFFSAKELKKRDVWVKKIAKESDALIFSSKSALNDFTNLNLKSCTKVHILNFSVATKLQNIISRDDLHSKYKINKPFFYLPNQFWAHKNHKAVINAVSIIEPKLLNFKIVMTGVKDDQRNPLHFENLINLIKKNNVNDTFVYLGLVPYSDVNALMFHSIAVINPSYCEGWSTTVEESKSLGVPLILSDLPVHREQAENFAEFFPPDDPHQLSMILKSHLKRYQGGAEGRKFDVRTQDCINHKLNTYGNQYQRIVLDLFGELNV